MSMLVQHDNMSHYPQSTLMNSAEGQGRQQRPTHIPSKRLLADELQKLYSILGQNRVTLATAVAQVLHGYNGTWRKQACGVFCFVKDYDSRCYCFRLYDLRSKQSIYEETVPAALRLEKALDVFYTFDGLNCKIGINFVDSDEAQTFSHHFHSKQEDRQNKREKKKGNAPLKSPPPISSPAQQPASSSSISSIINGIKPPVSNIVHTPTPAPSTSKTGTTKNPGFFTLGRKKKITRPDISAPIQSTWVHLGHIGTKDSFFNDDSQKEMFEKALASLNISADEKAYVRSFVNTDGGILKLLAKPAPLVRDTSNQGFEQMSSGQPAIPPRNPQTVGKSSGSRVPHQDMAPLSSVNNQLNNNRSQPFQGLFTPPTGMDQQKVPSIPPRPGGRVPDSGYSATQAPAAPPPPPPPPPPPFPTSQQFHTGSVTDSSRSHAPPAPPPLPPPAPPISNNFTTHSQGYGGPPPPPPPPPPPVSSSSSASSNQPNDLLDAIRKYDTTKLKSQNQRAPIPEFPSTGDTSPGAQDTMAINIMKILADRREKLIGREDEDESESSDEDWS